MLTDCALILFVVTSFCTGLAHGADQTTLQIDYPVGYRNWIYLTSGVDMNYDTNGKAPDHHMFDNVFVNPDAYKFFVSTGRWPDKTVLVKEVRGALTKGSINKSGLYQAPDTMELEVHMKDEKRFPHQWAFFVFGDMKPATIIPQTASCYACHSDHGAVDNTFVQFYPTLMPIAELKKSLAPAYRNELPK